MNIIGVLGMGVTFLNLPKVSVNEVVEGTIALVGSRVVSSSHHRTYSQNLSSQKIREASLEYTGYSPTLSKYIHDFDVVDLGDFDGDELGYVVRSILDSGGRAIIFGGDHTTTYYALKNVKPEKILVFDAHPDFAKYVDSLNHASVCRALKEAGWDLSIIGVRGYSSKLEEYYEAKKAGVNFLDCPKKIDDVKFMSIDLDFLEATIFPAIRVPEIGGYTISDFLKCIKEISFGKIVYVDFVEYAPDLDNSGVYAKVVAMLIIEIIAKMILDSGK